MLTYVKILIFHEMKYALKGYESLHKALLAKILLERSFIDRF